MKKLWAARFVRGGLSLTFACQLLHASVGLASDASFGCDEGVTFSALDATHFQITEGGKSWKVWIGGRITHHESKDLIGYLFRGAQAYQNTERDFTESLTLSRLIYDKEHPENSSFDYEIFKSHNYYPYTRHGYGSPNTVVDGDYKLTAKHCSIEKSFLTKQLDPRVLHFDVSATEECKELRKSLETAGIKVTFLLRAESVTVAQHVKAGTLDLAIRARTVEDSCDNSQAHVIRLSTEAILTNGTWQIPLKMGGGYGSVPFFYQDIENEASWHMAVSVAPVHKAVMDLFLKQWELSGFSWKKASQDEFNIFNTDSSGLSPRVRPDPIETMGSAQSAGGEVYKIFLSRRPAVDPLYLAIGPATISVRLPAEAELWIEGDKTEMTGPERTFVSPVLKGKQAYRYTLRARWTKEGNVFDQTKSVVVRAKQISTVVFDGADEK